jgi:hypothetical protein
MKKMSIFDRKFLASCKVRVEGRRRWYSDRYFLQACGISPEGFRDENTHRDISNCRGCGAHTFEQHTAECRHRALDGTEQLDGTQRLMAQHGLDPLNRADYPRLAFAGHPPAELDGEIEEMLPENLRDEINNAPSAGECGEPSHEPSETDDDDDEED